MRETPRLPVFVVDASVATKWYLLDEEDTRAADAVLADFREGRILLVAPDHIRYEVASAIQNAYRTNRLTNDQAQRATAEFLSWHIPKASGDDLILAAREAAIRFGCSFYDGLYVALAESAGCPLIFADRRLRNTLGGQFGHALWLTDYATIA
ncbi:MAG: type II toxin-antitoxin system VapC family toxin [Thermomicrobiales bacterium]